MDPLTIGLLTGGSSLIGSLFSSNTSAQNTQANIGMQQQTNQMNVEEAQKNRDFQQQMSSTAYQRSAQDMQKAGLNPAMMFGSGGAASTPSGSMPSLTAPKSDLRSPWSDLGGAVSKGLDAAVTAKTMERMTEEIAKIRTEAARTEAETVTEKARPELVRRETQNVAQDVTAKRLDRARQEWDAIKYLDLSGVPESARKTGNIASWGAGKAADVVAPLLSSALGARALSHTFRERWP